MRSGRWGEQQYGWLRGEAGLIWNPEPWITVGAAYMSSADAGRPDFPVDPLASRHGWLVRADYTRGPYFVRFLTKYDARRGGWYSNEYEIAIAADVFEPYIYSRDFPNTFQVGVRFRLDRFRDRVRARFGSRRAKTDAPRTLTMGRGAFILFWSLSGLFGGSQMERFDAVQPEVSGIGDEARPLERDEVNVEQLGLDRVFVPFFSR